MLRFSLLLLLTTLSGCLHVPLQKNFLDQSTTVSEIEHQQVIDNLAKFSVNPAALPHFSIPDTGTTQMAAQASGGMTFSYTRALFNGWGFNLGGNTTEQENWVIKPVNDPGRLQRMRCAYQLAVGARGEVDYDSDCVACIDQLKKVGLIKVPPPEPMDAIAAVPQSGEPSPATSDSEQSREQKEAELLLQSLNCNFPRGWFYSGRKCDVPKCACYVGRYCDTYVWVMPENLDDFTRFTLTILTLATTDPAGPNAVVERTLDAAGQTTGYKVTTKETVHFRKLEADSKSSGQSFMKMFGGVTPQEGVEFLGGPISEPIRTAPSDESTLQGLIQLK